jgi:2',3'-cyclic-nucleotide 2'-phosphodiesterase
MRILIFGDLVGQPGVAAFREALPHLREQHAPDVTIANVENIANGKGVSRDLLAEIFRAGVDVATTGDHAWDERRGIPLFETEKTRLLRPLNFPPGVPGVGATVLTKGRVTIAVANLIGRVFLRAQYDDPFRAVDAWLETLPRVRPLVTLVDVHAEATSEKRALGFFLDGRVSAVWGTHTHVPTGDEQLLPKGTAYLTDVGMCGALHSVIGVQTPPIIEGFRTQMVTGAKPEEQRPWEVNALLVDVDEATGKATGVSRIRELLS